MTALVIIGVLVLGFVIYKTFNKGNGPQNPTSGGQNYGSGGTSTSDYASSSNGGSYNGGAQR